MRIVFRWRCGNLSASGYYIHPELYGAPQEKGVEWVRHPDVMQRMKARQAKLAALAKK